MNRAIAIAVFSGLLVPTVGSAASESGAMPEAPDGSLSDANGNQTSVGIDCTLVDAARHPDHYPPVYDDDGTLPTIHVDLNGAILASPPLVGRRSVLQGFEEDEVLQVVVHGPEPYLSSLSVKRTSKFGGTEFRILGAQLELQSSGFTASDGDACPRRTVQLAGFSGDEEGKFSISVADDSGSPKVTGEVGFPVHPVYSAMLHWGPVVSGLEDEEFGVRAIDDMTNEIVRTNGGDTEVNYALMVTPFVWGKASAVNGFDNWWRAINPTIGLFPNDISDNVIVGLSYVHPKSGFALTVGQHFGETQQLASGLGIGDMTQLTEVPTERSWRSEPFVALSFDLRSTGALLNRVGEDLFKNVPLLGNAEDGGDDDETGE